MPLIPMVLDRSERMLSKPLTRLHLFLVLLNSPLHLIEKVFVYPPRDAATVFTTRALGLDRALGASAGGVVLNVSALLSGLEAEGEFLSSRAPIAILFEVIAEVFFAEEAALAAGGGLGLGTSGVIPSSIQALISLPW
jgi:hypothetical protein